MEVAEKSEKLFEGLKRVADRVEVKDNTYIITPKDDQTMAHIPGIIVEAGARMISIREDRESLEDIFLGAIKQEGKT